jgi:hypothetical protein
MKRASLLSLNQIHEIVTDLDSDEAEYQASGTQDEVEPCLVARVPSSQPPSSPDFPAGATEDEVAEKSVARLWPQDTGDTALLLSKASTSLLRS